MSVVKPKLQKLQKLLTGKENITAIQWELIVKVRKLLKAQELREKRAWQSRD